MKNKRNVEGKEPHLWVEEYRTKPGEGHSLKALYQYSTLSSS
jgi:hypothetical protein